MNHVGLIKVLNEGVVVLRWLGRTSSDRDGLWTRCKLRQRTKCTVTGVELSPGDTAWRPVGNQDYRGQRVSDWMIQQLVDDARAEGAID